MKRIMLTVAYEGTKYCGWQVQPNGLTVEEVLNGELSRLLKEEIQVVGASRTDAGVHAMGNVAVFDTNTQIPAEKLSYALNRSLPDDIVIQNSREVRKNFHPRKTESRKTYEYRIWNADFVQPFNRNYPHFIDNELDMARAINNSKIIVNHNSQGISSLNYRTVQAVACKRLLISDYREELDLFEGNLPFYEDFSDLIFKIESYLEDEEAYNKVVEICYQIAKNNHNSKDNVSFMLHLVR